MVSVYNMLTKSFGTIQIVVCLEGGVEYGFYDFIKQNKVIPLKTDGKTITIGVVDPSNKSILNEVVFISGLRPVVKLVTHMEFESFVENHFNESKKETEKILKELETDTDIVEEGDSFLDQIKFVNIEFH